MDKKTLSVGAKPVDITSPIQVIEFASTLKKYILEQKLYVNIQGKNYALVESWQFAGLTMGMVPIIERAERVDADNEVKYRAEASVRRLVDGATVGYGVAVCSNKEGSRKLFDEYAVCSMAQTRAIGKAYRNMIGFVIKLAGYEATPAEEMTDIKKPDTEELANEKEYKRVLTHIIDSQTIEQLQEVEGLIEKHALENQYKEKMELLND